MAPRRRARRGAAAAGPCRPSTRPSSTTCHRTHAGRGAPRGRRRPARPGRRARRLDLGPHRSGLEGLRRRALVGAPTPTRSPATRYAYRHALLRDAGYASLARAERAPPPRRDGRLARARRRPAGRMSWPRPSPSTSRRHSRAAGARDRWSCRGTSSDARPAGTSGRGDRARRRAAPGRGTPARAVDRAHRRRSHRPRATSPPPGSARRERESRRGHRRARGGARRRRAGRTAAIARGRTRWHGRSCSRSASRRPKPWPRPPSARSPGSRRPCALRSTRSTHGPSRPRAAPMASSRRPTWPWHWPPRQTTRGRSSRSSSTWPPPGTRWTLGPTPTGRELELVARGLGAWPQVCHRASRARDVRGMDAPTAALPG